MFGNAMNNNPESLLWMLCRASSVQSNESVAPPCSSSLQLIEATALPRLQSTRSILATNTPSRDQQHQLLLLQYLAALRANAEERPISSFRIQQQPLQNREGRSQTTIGVCSSNNTSNESSINEETLKGLGSKLRETYLDVSRAVIPTPCSKAMLPCRGGGSTKNFTKSLHKILQDERFSDIVSFLPHGRAFCVFDQEAFAKTVMPMYFPKSKTWKTFSRQLSLYGFRRLNSGPDVGCYYHELFLQGRPDLAQYMGRVGIPSGGRDRRRERARRAQLADPNFYAMASCGTSTNASK